MVIWNHIKDKKPDEGRSFIILQGSHFTYVERDVLNYFKEYQFAKDFYWCYREDLNLPKALNNYHHSRSE